MKRTNLKVLLKYRTGGNRLKKINKRKYEKYLLLKLN